MKKVLLLELNEFNADLLEAAASILNLKNIRKLVSLHKTTTITDDTYESDYLEPWVQWVSIHTGSPSSFHQIKHLGDVPYLGIEQIWERLSSQGISSGIWGAMNASRSTANACHFFLPDPWTSSEYAYPSELNYLLDPLRYLAKNYSKQSHLRLLQKLKNLLALFSSNNLGWPLISEIPRLLGNIIRFKGEHFIFISFFDYLSVRFFLKYLEKYSPTFSLIFLNSLAHLQHHHWKGFDYSKNKRLILGLQYLDQALFHLFESLKKDDIFIATNALSQKNTNKEKPWILYRQIDQAKFLNTVGIPHIRIESHMTHDAHIFFENTTDAISAKAALESARILDQRLFLVETYPQDPKKLFFRICFTDQVPPNTLFTLRNSSYPFLDLFKAVVRRTGKHIPHGTIYSNISFPKMMMNHELFAHIESLFKQC